ncbi:unnamed protein product [Arctogadus glacialis]
MGEQPRSRLGSTPGGSSPERRRHGKKAQISPALLSYASCVFSWFLEQWRSRAFRPVGITPNPPLALVLIQRVFEQLDVQQHTKTLKASPTDPNRKLCYICLLSMFLQYTVL